MTPTPPSGSNPLIYRIADALGITHLVVAVQHSHLMSEIEGLVSALAGKMDAKTIDSVPANNADHLVSSKGVYDALMAINNLSSITSYGSAIVHAEAGNNPLVQIALQRTGETLVDAKISLANIANLNRALANPDSTPTAGSDNLVTSGGVKAALDAKYSINQVDENDEQEAHLSAIAEYDDIYFDFRLKNGNTQKEVLLTISKMDNFARAISNPDSIPTANSTNLVTSGGVKAALDGKAPAGDTEVIFEDGENIFVYLPDYFTNGERQRSFILNYQGEAAELIDLFEGNTNDSIRILSHDDSIITVAECYIAVRVIKQSGIGAQGDTYYIIFDGKNEY